MVRGFHDGFRDRVGREESITAKLLPLEDSLNWLGRSNRWPFETPDFKKWMKQVASMAAEEQVEAVANKLQELNVFFDGKETHTIENGG